jgi:hypothetical protein
MKKKWWKFTNISLEKEIIQLQNKVEKNFDDSKES